MKEVDVLGYLPIRSCSLVTAHSMRPARYRKFGSDSFPSFVRVSEWCRSGFSKFEVVVRTQAFYERVRASAEFENRVICRPWGTGLEVGISDHREF